MPSLERPQQNNQENQNPQQEKISTEDFLRIVQGENKEEDVLSKTQRKKLEEGRKSVEEWIVEDIDKEKHKEVLDFFKNNINLSKFKYADIAMEFCYSMGKKIKEMIAQEEEHQMTTKEYLRELYFLGENSKFKKLEKLLNIVEFVEYVLEDIRDALKVIGDNNITQEFYRYIIKIFPNGGEFFRQEEELDALFILTGEKYIYDEDRDWSEFLLNLDQKIEENQENILTLLDFNKKLQLVRQEIVKDRRVKSYFTRVLEVLNFGERSHFDAKFLFSKCSELRRLLLGYPHSEYEEISEEKINKILTQNKTNFIKNFLSSLYNLKQIDDKKIKALYRAFVKGDEESLQNDDKDLYEKLEQIFPLIEDDYILSLDQKSIPDEIKNNRLFKTLLLTRELLLSDVGERLERSGEQVFRFVFEGQYYTLFKSVQNNFLKLQELLLKEQKEGQETQVEEESGKQEQSESEEQAKAEEGDGEQGEAGEEQQSTEQEEAQQEEQEAEVEQQIQTSLQKFLESVRVFYDEIKYDRSNSKNIKRAEELLSYFRQVITLLIDKKLFQMLQDVLIEYDKVKELVLHKKLSDYIEEETRLVENLLKRNIYFETRNKQRAELFKVPTILPRREKGLRFVLRLKQVHNLIWGRVDLRSPYSRLLFKEKTPLNDLRKWIDELENLVKAGDFSLSPEYDEEVFALLRSILVRLRDLYLSKDYEGEKLKDLYEKVLEILKELENETSVTDTYLYLTDYLNNLTEFLEREGVQKNERGLPIVLARLVQQNEEYILARFAMIDGKRVVDRKISQGGLQLLTPKTFPDSETIKSYVYRELQKGPKEIETTQPQESSAQIQQSPTDQEHSSQQQEQNESSEDAEAIQTIRQKLEGYISKENINVGVVDDKLVNEFIRFVNKFASDGEDKNSKELDARTIVRNMFVDDEYINLLFQQFFKQFNLPQSQSESTESTDSGEPEQGSAQGGSDKQEQEDGEEEIEGNKEVGEEGGEKEDEYEYEGETKEEDSDVDEFETPSGGFSDEDLEEGFETPAKNSGEGKEEAQTEQQTSDTNEEEEYEIQEGDYEEITPPPLPEQQSTLESPTETPEQSQEKQEPREQESEESEQKQHTKQESTTPTSQEQTQKQELSEELKKVREIDEKILQLVRQGEQGFLSLNELDEKTKEKIRIGRKSFWYNLVEDPSWLGEILQSFGFNNLGDKIESKFIDFRSILNEYGERKYKYKENINSEQYVKRMLEFLNEVESLSKREGVIFEDFQEEIIHFLIRRLNKVKYYIVKYSDYSLIPIYEKLYQILANVRDKIVWDFVENDIKSLPRYIGVENNKT